VKISLVPWEIIWLLSWVIFIISLIWFIVERVKIKKFSLPKSFVLYASLLILIVIPLGLKVFNYRFHLGAGAGEITAPYHELIDLQTHQYKAYTVEQLYQASLRAVQSLSTYGQPWTIVFAEHNEEAGRIAVQVPVFFVIDDLAIIIHSVEDEVGLFVTVNSTSRLRATDLGENARHIKQFYQTLDAELAKSP
jgi:uncharacterized protein (DUF1499 family)